MRPGIWWRMRTSLLWRKFAIALFAVVALFLAPDEVETFLLFQVSEQVYEQILKDCKAFTPLEWLPAHCAIDCPKECNEPLRCETRR